MRMGSFFHYTTAMISLTDHKQLAEQIFNRCHLTGTFKLRSGQTSHEYFDKYRIESDPKLLAAVAELFHQHLPKNIDALAGLELGGVPLATALALKSGKPVCFVRKKAKDYGTCQLAEGLQVEGKKLCVIEDVITSGGQVIESVAELRKLGAQIDTVMCVINRGGDEALAKLSAVNLKLISLFVRSDFPK